MRPLYIFDLDGTLRNHQHRVHHLLSTPKDYDAFHAACHLDTEIRTTCELARFLGWVTDYNFGSPEVWLWTGASESSKQITELWLLKHQIAYSDLRMRLRGDRRKDHDLKESWLHQMRPVDRERLVMVFEDRQRVVDMWRKNGVTCAQVAPGAF